MRATQVVRAVPESGAAPADAGADGAAGGAEANESVEVALTKNEKGYGLGFDQYGGAVFVTRIVAGGAAEATGQVGHSARRRRRPEHDLPTREHGWLVDRGQFLQSCAVPWHRPAFLRCVRACVF